MTTGLRHSSLAVRAASSAGLSLWLVAWTIPALAQQPPCTCEHVPSIERMIKENEIESRMIERMKQKYTNDAGDPTLDPKTRQIDLRNRMILAIQGPTPWGRST